MKIKQFAPLQIHRNLLVTELKDGPFRERHVITINHVGIVGKPFPTRKIAVILLCLLGPILKHIFLHWNTFKNFLKAGCDDVDLKIEDFPEAFPANLQIRANLQVRRGSMKPKEYNGKFVELL